MIGDFKDVAETFKTRFAESPLGKQLFDVEIFDIGDEFDLPLEETGEAENPIPMKTEDSELDTNCDDNGQPYLNENGERIPNNTYALDGITYKSDDKDNIYMLDGKLVPNTIYELKSSIYTTDDKGRIVGCEAKPQHSPENPRDNDAQRQAGGEDRKPNDHGGHIVGRDLNGDGGGGNLVAMDSKINQSDYTHMEKYVKNSLDEGKGVTTKTEITYNGNSERPDKITVMVTVDGKNTVYKFDNNIDGSLMDEVPKNGQKGVRAELNATKGEISSMKEEYDENGNLEKTNINITYTDEDGSTHRNKVVIDNTQGGEN